MHSTGRTAFGLSINLAVGVVWVKVMLESEKKFVLQRMIILPIRFRKETKNHVQQWI